MPIYEFHCLDCQDRYEVRLSHQEMKQAESAFSGLQKVGGGALASADAPDVAVRATRFASGLAAAACPQCGQHPNPRVLSRFAVGGRGDLREHSHWDGCHETHE